MSDSVVRLYSRVSVMFVRIMPNYVLLQKLESGSLRTNAQIVEILIGVNLFILG